LHEAGADAAGSARAQPLLFLALLGDLLQQMHVGFVGSEDVHRDRRQWRITGRLEHDRLAAMVETEPAPFAADMRRYQPAGARQRDELMAEFLGGTMRGLPLVGLARHDV